MRYGIAPPACPTSHRIFGSCLNTPAKQSFAIASVVSNGKPTIGPSTYSVNASAAAGIIGCTKTQTFRRSASSKSGRYPGSARALEPDDPLAGRARPEREVAAAPLDTLEVGRGVVVRVQVELHGRSFTRRGD